MPVRPENRGRYPADWKAISHATKERAGWRCQGSPAYPKCRVPHGSIGARDDRGIWRELARLPRDATPAEARQLHAETQYSVGEDTRLVRIVLTVGHFDHQPENCDPGNLFAWCQRCHLFHDRHHHAATRVRTRRAGKALGDLLE